MRNPFTRPGNAFELKTKVNRKPDNGGKILGVNKKKTSSRLHYTMSARAALLARVARCTGRALYTERAHAPSRRPLRVFLSALSNRRSSGEVERRRRERFKMPFLGNCPVLATSEMPRGHPGVFESMFSVCSEFEAR